MGLLSNGNITLVDLTDTRSVTLYLSTSLSKTQVESEGSYQPDYSLEDGQVITPSLYFGQDKEDDFEISYFINNNEIISEEGSIYIKNKNLYIKENLTENKLITAIVRDITDPSTGILYNQIESQIELIKVSNPKENFFPLIEYDRTVFSNEKPENIILKAVLYKGGTPYTNGVFYKWTSSNENDLEENGSTLSVTRDDVINVTSFQCEMSIGEDSNASTYLASVTLTDWTDPLSSQIISNKGVYLQNVDDKIGLTCNIFRKNQKINEDNSTKTIYKWSYYSTDENDFLTLEEGEDKKEIEIDINQFKGFSSVLFQCEAQVKKTGTNDQFEETSAQITIAISPAYRVEITPRNILISCDKDGNIKSEEDNFVKDITFKLLDLDGNILARAAGDGVGDISFFGNVITAEPKEENLWNYNIKLESSKNNILEDNYLINIPYTYFGFQDSDEIYLIKSIQGETGEQGKSITIKEKTYTISEIEIKNIEENTEVVWKTDFPVSIPEGYYLYTKTTFSDGESIYSVVKQGSAGEAAIYNYIKSNTSIITKKIEESYKEEDSEEIKYQINNVYSPSELIFSSWQSKGIDTGLKNVFWRYYIDNSETPVIYENESSSLSLVLAEHKPEISIRVEAFTLNEEEQEVLFDVEQIEIISEEQQVTIAASNDTITVPYSFDDENGWSGAIENASTTIKAYYGNTAVQGAIFEIEPCIEGDELQYEGIRQDEDGSYFIKVTNWGGSVEKEKRRRIITVTVTYGQYEIKKDIELIKVFNGQGIEGEEKFYALSNNGKTAPAENDVRWVDSVTKFPADNLIYTNYSFLWIKTILYFSDGTKTVGYSVFGWNGESFNISNIVEEYAFSNSYNINEETLIISPQENLEWFSILEETIAEKTLLVRYSFTKIDEKKQKTTSIYQAKDIKDLNLFLQYADVLIKKHGIDLFASSVIEDSGSITYAETVMGIRAGEIKAVVEESTEDGEGVQRTTQSYLTFNTEGLTIGSKNSDYYSQILNGTKEENYLDAGFYIKYNNNQTEQENVAILNTLGLRVKNINLNLKDSNFEQDLTITRTLTGGIAIGY